MTAPSALHSVDVDRLAPDQHGARALKNPALSPAQEQAIARREVADLIWRAFGGPGKTQKAVAAAGAKLTGYSERQIVNYLKMEHDAPLWLARTVEKYVIAKTERLARRIEGP